jgi:hypothetical protein
MSLEQQKLVRTLVKALDAIEARLRRVPLDDEKQACRELTDILHTVRAILAARKATRQFKITQVAAMCRLSKRYTQYTRLI